MADIPNTYGFANPFYGKAANLVANIEEYRAIARQIQRQCDGEGGRGPCADINAVMQACEAAGIKEKLRVLFQQSQDGPPTPPVLGVPPPPAEIYGRFDEGLKVIDVGPGNGSKIRKFTGVLKFTCVDPSLDCPKLTVTRVLMPLSLYITQITGDPIFSSYMTACQLPHEEQEELFSHDGLHMIPNHEWLCAVGAAERADNKIMVHTPSPWKDYLDEPVPDMGYEIEPGYNLLATFKPRRIAITTGAPEKQSSRAQEEDNPALLEDMNISDLGFKWKGTFCELECSKGIAYLVDRSGNKQLGCSGTFQDHICLHLVDVGNCYALQRVMAYRGFIPPHCGETLRRFAEVVKITIDDKPVCGPPPWKPDGKVHLSWYDEEDKVRVFSAPVEGVISRSRGKDFYCKHQWSIDDSDPQDT